MNEGCGTGMSVERGSNLREFEGRYRGSLSTLVELSTSRRQYDMVTNKDRGSLSIPVLSSRCTQQRT
ncbi:hypothetical protein BT96DRAFT_918635 [Gymnopus androsaceus JB14]|uniref:Uncharacterized protein n=1 Tax=Gymnopus androsaceus JB14 TaxID=1447944 RepID=A0A6A4HRM2_9AGAR|nr:hypothetical protein BT96DRAFT_918635 [Gymnopus androsaceus JB14]